MHANAYEFACLQLVAFAYSLFVVATQTQRYAVPSPREMRPVLVARVDLVLAHTEYANDAHGCIKARMLHIRKCIKIHQDENAL